MKKRICTNILKKIIISITCLVTVFFSVPIKSDANVIQDLLEIVLKLPDAVMWILNTTVSQRNSDLLINVNLKGVHGGPLGKDDNGSLFNMTVTPYDIFTNGRVQHYKNRYGEDVSVVNLPILNANFFSTSGYEMTGYTELGSEHQTSSNDILRPAIGNVYKKLRNFCMIVMLLVLLYIGIKIMISSIAEQQAKYKKNLVDWLVAFALLFIMHYFMAFIMSLNDLIVNMLQSDESQTYYISFASLGSASGAGSGFGEEWYEFFDDYDGKVFIDLHLAIPGNAKDAGNGEWQDSGTGFMAWLGVKKSQGAESLGDNHFDMTSDQIVDVTKNGGAHTDWGDNGKVKISAQIWDGEHGDEHVCIYRANLLEYVRTISTYDGKYVRVFNSDGSSRTLTVNGSDNGVAFEPQLGYGILYIALVVQTIMFLTTYLKRLIQLAFLTMIAPFVALMYPIDKIGDGKAQSFNSWFKDYFFGVLIQPLHLLLYTIFVVAASDLFSTSIIYAIAVYTYMLPAEKYIKKIFGFEKASGPSPAAGGMQGAIGHGLAMDGLGKLSGIGPAGKGRRQRKG